MSQSARVSSAHGQANTRARMGQGSDKVIRDVGEGFDQTFTKKDFYPDSTN